ncbi:MAG TPA: hydroxyacylglutathione hydrolase [Sedimentisphaerales bacterium]|nr:hydroxyacylglutathione hydrolase [Sedimentisphaerales bacterium]HRS12016.1 hydroxyacylglutathione hydrolase [Sedimentisphaerales bacterium]HRV50006.1 hydroxyacylglutathione hydrolase [Sedimentisphaerales bacterium]
MDSECTSTAGDRTTTLTCGDNYVYIHACADRRAFVVDPTDATMVGRTIAQQKLTLTTALLTHHHGDHTTGLAELKSRTSCRGVGPDERRIAGIDQLVRDGDVVTLNGRTIQVIGTPGHTSTSVCYYLPPSPNGRPGIVFTGDTLFVGGCGRPMECDAHVLWESLMRLAALPAETLVYCGHNYTAENYEFALSIEPGNRVVAKQLRRAIRNAAQGHPTVPSTIARERATNIFLRAGESAVKTAVNMIEASPEQVFAELRQRKNLFG